MSLAALHGVACLVYVIDTEDQSSARGEVDQVDIDPGVSYAAADLPQGTWSVLDFQDQDWTLATYLNASLFQGLASRGSDRVLHQDVP